MRNDDFDARAIRGGGFLIFCASWIFFAAVLAWQCFLYLRDGVWIPFGLLSMLGELFQWSWAIWPDKWFGLHQIMEFFNIGAFAALAGSVIGGAMSVFENN